MQVTDLDQRLQKDCYFLGALNGHGLLLSRNAYFPWFILVPDTKEIEFYKLDWELQISILDLINKLSNFIEKHFSVDKLNIATIGNVVPQMHIHIVGRSKKDPCWPGVVWGCDQFKYYDEGFVDNIREYLETELTDVFTAAR